MRQILDSQSGISELAIIVRLVEQMLVHELEISMINIGCDIGKSDFDVYFLGKHRKFSNNSEGISKFLAMYSKNTDVRVVLEPTRGYEKQLISKLFETKTQVSVVNPYYVRNFAKSFRDLAKTDKIDSKVGWPRSNGS